VSDETLHGIAVVLRRASGLLGWAAFGEFVGHFAGLAIPDALVSDTLVGHIAAILMVLVGAIGAWTHPTTGFPGLLRDRLARVDLLFLRGSITDHERDRLRLQILRRTIGR